MSSRYALGSMQREVWTSRIEELAKKRGRGVWTRIAKALAGRDDPQSWKTRLVRFKKGEESDLRSVFDNPRQLAKVASGLDIDARRLESILAEARGEERSDPSNLWRIPGWEDRPPVDAEAAVFPPRLRRIGGQLRGPDVILPGYRIDLGALAEHAIPEDPPRPKTVVLIGEPGGGRTATLRSLTARLGRRDVLVSWWPDVEAEVVVVDDFDQLGAENRRRIGSTVKEGKLAVVAATIPDDPLTDLPYFGVGYELLRGDREWAEMFIDHLECLLRQHVHGESSLESLRELLDEDPFAIELCLRADTIGSMARSVSEGHSAGARQRQLEVFLNRAVEHMRARRRNAEASFFDTRGKEALGLLVERTGGEGSSHQQLVDVWAEVGRGDGVGELGVHSLIEMALDAGLLSNVDETYFLRPPQLAQMALGWRLARALKSEVPEGVGRLVEKCILEPSLSGALAFAGESLEDLAPVLTAIAALDSSILCQAFPGLTRLLACETGCSDPELFARWYGRALAWWTAWPRAPEPAPVRNQEAVWRERLASETDVSGLGPHVVLGLAAVRHAGDLQGLDLERVVSDALESDLRCYLTAVGGQPARAKDNSWQLAIAALDQVEQPEGFWERVREKLWRAPEDGPFEFLKDLQLEQWLAHVAGPILLNTAEGRRLAAGLDDITVDTFLGGRGFAASRWVDALVEQLEVGASGADEAFAEAVELGLENLSKRSQEAIFEVWNRAENRRDNLSDAVVRRLSSKVPGKTWPDRTTWKRLLETALEGRAAALTSDWVRAECEYIPWRSLIDAGADAVDVARWVARNERHPRGGHDGELSAQVEAAKERLLSLRRPDVLAAWLRIASVRAIEERAPALVTLDALVARPLQALKQLSDDTSRRHRLELGADGALPRSVRIQLTLALVPRTDEVEAWRVLAELAVGRLESALRGVQRATAEATSDAMHELARELDQLADWISAPEEAFDEAEGQLAILFSDGPIPMRSSEEWCEFVARERHTILREIVDCLQAATDRGVEAVEGVVEVLSRRSELWPWPFDPQSAAFSALVHRHLGWDELSRLLRREGAAEVRLSYSWHELCNVEGFAGWFVALLDDDQLAIPAARLMARVDEDRAIRMLESRRLIRGSHPDPVGLQLALGASVRDPGLVLDILEPRLGRGRREARQAWWEALLPAMPRGDERARVSRRLFEVSSQHRRRRRPGPRDLEREESEPR